MNLILRGRLTTCVLLWYRTPLVSVEHLVPPGLELVRRGPWAFWNIVACRVESLRPANLPAWPGISYHHVAYRLLVRAMNHKAEVRRGLYFVRSDADSSVVSTLANWFSDFQTNPAEIDLCADEHRVALRVRSTADAHLVLDRRPPTRQPGSCFPTLRDAQECLRYCPLAMATHGSPPTLALTRVERDESAWQETPISVVEARWGFFDGIDQHDVHLELATRAAAIDYRWVFGQREPLLGFASDQEPVMEHT